MNVHLDVSISRFPCAVPPVNGRYIPDFIATATVCNHLA